MVTRNEELFARAQKTIPGGVNSPVRAFRSVGGAPRFFVRGEGAYVWDISGELPGGRLMRLDPSTLTRGEQLTRYQAWADGHRGRLAGARRSPRVRESTAARNRTAATRAGRGTGRNRRMTEPRWTTALTTVRAAEQQADQPRYVEGMAVPYEVEYDAGSYREVFSRGAFKASVDQRDNRAPLFELFVEILSPIADCFHPAIGLFIHSAPPVTHRGVSMSHPARCLHTGPGNQLDHGVQTRLPVEHRRSPNQTLLRL